MAALDSEQHLWAHFYFLEPTYSRSICTGLLSSLRSCAPEWCRHLAVHDTEDDRRPLVLGDLPLLQALEMKSPPLHGLGSWVLRGTYPGLFLYLHSSRSTHSPSLNSVALELVSIAEIEGQPVATWLRAFFRALVDSSPITYGNARCAREYAHSNLDQGNGSVRAIGTNFHNSLPGLYWLNHFGPEYVELIGCDRLLTSPAAATDVHQSSVTLLLAESPSGWNTRDYTNRRDAVLDHLGRRFFFDRRGPAGSRSAPDFYALARQRRGRQSNSHQS